MVSGFFTCFVFIVDLDDEDNDIAGINFPVGRRSTEVEGRKLR